jgi:hypothetical protein
MGGQDIGNLSDVEVPPFLSVKVVAQSIPKMHYSGGPS